MYCRNCGELLNGDICDKCGYNSNVKNPFKNVIADKKTKEDIGDGVLAYLVNAKEITKEDFKNLKIEFGYLFLDDDNEVNTLLKVIVPKKLFKHEKVFYIAIQKKRLMLLGDNFTEQLFRKTSQDMLVMHKVDLNNKNNNDYFMELS